MFGLFRANPVLDEGSTAWLFEAYAWALRNIGSDAFQRTILVTPTDRHFPDTGSGTERAAAAFARVRSYAGMQGLPFELAALTGETTAQSVPALFDAEQGGMPGITLVQGEQSRIPIAFDPATVKKPQVLVAAFAQQLAFHLGRAMPEESPGGEELRGPASDLLAVFMGFGLFFANSALTVCRGGCSGCGTSVQKLGYLTEEEFTYALAIFCTLKDIQNSEVEPHLKKTLRPIFRVAMKELGKTRAEDINRLKALQTSTPVAPSLPAIAPLPPST